MFTANELVTVEVAYALPDRYFLREVSVLAGCPLYEAVIQSGVGAEFPTLDLDKATFGIFGKVIANRTQPVKAGDRIEIYRPLIADPKEARRARAAGQA